MHSRIEINELRQIQLDILKKVASFCDQNDLKYFLAYGTLIGAVRHKGYIPWDDDIDIAMPRPDYERFLKVFQGVDCSTIFYRTDPDCIYPFAKVVDNRTIMEEDVALKTRMGVYIDIFPLDGWPDSKEESKKFIRQINILKNKLMSKTVAVRRQKTLLKNILILGAKIVFLFSDYRKNIIKLDKLVQKYPYNKEKFVGNAIWGYAMKERVPKEIFDDYTEVEFEGKRFKAPIGYDQWLRHVYGDYMQLPPEEKRVMPHASKAYWKS